MPLNSITKINAPGQGCDSSVSVIREASQKASYSANCDTKSDWNRKQIARGSSHSKVSFDHFDCKNSTRDPTNHGLSWKERTGSFQPAQHSASQCRTYDSACNNPPSQIISEVVPLPATKVQES